MAKRPGKLIVISAPSGCGKTTIVERLLGRNQNFVRSISYTTRQPRAGETNGRDYFFISEAEFLAKQKERFFLESARVFSHWYGTSKEFVLGYLSRGKNVILAIDVQGMKQLCAALGKEIPTVSIFIMPPSLDILRERLKQRKTETSPQIGERLKIAQGEMEARSMYDFVVVNRKIDQAVKEIEEIVQ